MAKIMAKKGQTPGYVIRWLIAIIILVIPFFLVFKFLILPKGLETPLNTYDLEYYLLMNRIFYSTNSIFYYDIYTGRTDFEKVDIAKFNEDTLKNLFDEKSNVKIALKLTISGHEPIYYNRKLYDNINPIIKNKIVLVRYGNGNEEKKLLTVNVGFVR